MPIEGRLSIDLFPVAAQGERVHIQSSRPLQAAQLFIGKTPECVLGQLPLLYSVCGFAQGTASVKAFHQACSLPVNSALDAAYRILVALETAREHLWRVLIDWPAFLGEAPAAAGPAVAQSLLPRARRALFVDGTAFVLEPSLKPYGEAIAEVIATLDTQLTETVFGTPVDQWLALDSDDDLLDWIARVDTVATRLLRKVRADGWQSLGSIGCCFLPALSHDSLNARLSAPDAEAFVAEPSWDDAPCETTPLARQQAHPLIRSLQGAYGQGLLTRLVARLVELASLPGAMRTAATRLDGTLVMSSDEPLPAGTGIGQIEAARGRLVHRVEMDDGHVRRYQILAPTEWNFHPSGALARGLGCLPATHSGDLQQQAALLIDSVDPCVSYDVRVH